MIFLSTLLRQGIYDNEDRRVGTVRDVCVALNETFPVVTALVAHTTANNGDTFIPWSQVHNLEEPHIQLTVNRQEMVRSEEHTSELQSRPHLVCRLLLEKKKTNSKSIIAIQL